MSEPKTPKDPKDPKEDKATTLRLGSSVSSDTLLAGKSELRIRHNGETYSLRKTRLNKLILTK